MSAAPAMKERELHDAILEMAKRFGWRAASFGALAGKHGRFLTPVKGDAKGFPDILAVRGKRMVAAELKAGRNKPTAEQEAWLQAFADAGALACVWTEKDWPAAVEMVLR